MTNPLPESAVELAARAMHFEALRNAPGAPAWDVAGDAVKDYWRGLARAALPAIREAVVGEYRELVEAARGYRNAPGGSGVSVITARIAAEKRLDAALAALNEQENRNG